METLLSHIDPDKRARIVNAAIEEFAHLPYEKASTNHIVSKAGISKGLLFHYFGNKQDLYETLVKFVIQTLYQAIVSRIDWEQADLFERIKQVAIVKLEVGQIYPHMFDFMLRLFTNQRTETVAEMIALYKGYGFDFQQLNEDLYTRNVDYSRFRDPSTIPQAINIVRWSLEKYGEEYLLGMGGGARMELQQAVAGMDQYVDLLKKLLYQ